MDNNTAHISRRKVLQSAALLGVGGMLSPSDVASAEMNSLGAKRRAVTDENQMPGTTEWQLQYTSSDPITLVSNPLIRNLRSPRIEGYASRTSVYPGETVDFKVSANPAADFYIDIYRMGYYRGTGGRRMTRLGPFSCKPQPMPMMTVERLRECDWQTATALTIPADWPSGVYLAKLSLNETFGTQSYIIFVVKARRPG